MIATPFIKVASFTIPTAAGHICPFALPNDWRMLASIPRWAALAVPMTTPWPSPSTVCTRQKSFTGLDLGKTLAAVAREALKWVDWLNNRRLLAPIGYIPPSEAEQWYYAQFNTLGMVA